ncbi:integrase, catalytic region, zinc finger, CCHC-type containing protein [Tanacetum coccineum]
MGSREQPATTKRIKWKPTGRTFTIVGNMCPLTRITSTKVKPLKENTSKSVTTPNLEIKIYRRKTKVAKSVDLSNEPGCLNCTVRFGNDHIAKIMGYGDYQMGNVTISQVYYVEGLGHNLFSVGQFCDSDLEVAFCKHTCYIRDLEGVDLLKGLRGSNLYTLSLEDMMLSSPSVSYLKPQTPSLGYGIEEAVVTACYTKDRSLICKHHNKTPYVLLHNRKPYLSYLYVFGALCYPTNDSEDLGKLKPKAHIRIFIGYTPAKKAYRIYNKRTRLIIETIHVDFDELTSMDSCQIILLQYRILPTKKKWDTLFQPMFDEYFNPPPSVVSLVPAVAAPRPPDPTEEFHDIEAAHLENDPFFGVSIPESNSEESSSRDVIPTNLHSVNQPLEE